MGTFLHFPREGRRDVVAAASSQILPWLLKGVVVYLDSSVYSSVANSPTENIEIERALNAVARKPV
jgi:hypothetical protein